MENNNEDTAHVVGEYIENISGIIKMVENRSNPWRIMIRSPKKWVLDRPIFKENHPDIQPVSNPKRPNLVLKKEISESFEVFEDAYSVQCNIYYRSAQIIVFDEKGIGSISYEVVLTYVNEEKENKRLSKKGKVLLNGGNQPREAKITFENHSIQRDNEDNIVVSALMIAEL